MGAIVIRTRYDEGTESAEVATSDTLNTVVTSHAARMRRLSPFKYMIGS